MSPDWRVVWDEAKNRANRRKHGLDFGDAPAMFEYDGFVLEDDREDYGEERWLWITSAAGRTVVVGVYTEPDEFSIRIISFRRAPRENDASTAPSYYSDMARVKAMRDDEIDFSDSPEITEEAFKRARFVPGTSWRELPPHLRTALGRAAVLKGTGDVSIAAWFADAPEGCDAAIRSALREYMERHPRES